MTTAVDEIGKLRRAYFALAKSLGLDEFARHALNARLCAGRSSTKLFGLLDWRAAVAELQRLAGQDSQPGRPRLRTRGREDARTRGTLTPETRNLKPSFDFATASQVALIEDLATRIHWRVGPAMFVRSRILCPLRKMNWPGSWPTLSRSEATAVIVAMQKMAKTR